MKPPLSLLASTILLCGMPVSGAVIENDSCKISVANATGVISIAGTGASGVAEVSLPGVTGAGEPSATKDPVFGAGKDIVLTGKDGPLGTLRLYRNLPFALVRLTVKNPDARPVVLDKVPVASLQVKLGVPADQTITLSSNGLQPAGKKPGGYAWMAVADPKTRQGVVAGWLTHERANGTLFASVEDGEVKIAARGEYGTLRIASGAKAESETLMIGSFADARLGLEAWADAVAKNDRIELRPLPSGYCTWYSDKNGGSGNEKGIAELSAFAAKVLKPHGFSFVQIDDKWQLGNSKNGPQKNFTAHNPKAGYPSGMKATADMIKADGLTPGLWFMPFSGNWDDPFFADHQEWFVKRKDGKPFESKWSATCLDMSQPGAREYVRSVVSRIAKDWGYTYFKMDGFHSGAGTSNVYVNAGYKNDDMSEAVFADPDKSNIEVFRSGIRLVREAAGPGVFFLGCCVTQNMRSYEGSFGLVDAMRVGPDNNGSWKGWSGASPVYGTRHYFLNGRVWWNDPDPEYVRASLTLDEARTMATWTALSGQLNANSDWLPGLPADRIEILKRTLAPHKATARPVDLFESGVPKIWLVSQANGDTRSDVAGLYNWSDEEMPVEITAERLGLAPAKSYAAFDFWANAFLPPVEGTLRTKLAPHACQALALRPMLDHPFLLSTSRHVTQGMTDASDEKWSPANKTLAGRSQVVAGDLYELRVVAPGASKAMRAETGDRQKMDLIQNGSELRASFTPSATAAVDWKIVFE